jgi:site-specific DNA recombinase
VLSGKPVTKLRAYGWDDGVIVPDEAERVRWIFEEAEKRSLAQITRDLRDMQVPTPSGKGRWQNSNLLMICRNTLYKGEYQYGRKRKHRPGTRGRASCAVEPLVSLEQWERTNRALDSRMSNKRNHGSRQDVFPMQGYMVCGVCGSAMSGITGKGKKGEPRTFYRCWRAISDKSSEKCSHKRHYHAQRLHERIRTDLAEISNNQEALKTAIKQPVPKKLDTKADRERLERRLENAIKMRLDAEITRDELAVIRADTERGLALLEAQTTPPPAPQIDLSRIQKQIEEVLNHGELHQIANALKLTVSVTPDGTQGWSKTLSGVYDYVLEL